MKHKLVRRLALVLSVVMLITSTINTSYAFIVTQTDSIVNTFTSGVVSSPGSVTIRKTVEHPLGDGYVIPDTIAFGFKVELGEAYADKTVHTSAGDMVASANGNLSVSVKPNVPFVVEGIDEGTNVVVTELTERCNPGFSVKEGMPITQMGTVSTAGVVFDFVNVYAPESVSATKVSVVGEKILTGRDWREGDLFFFKLEQEMEDGSWVEVGSRTISYDAASANFNEFDFSDSVQSMVFEECGSYQFRMTEVAGSEDGMDYDESVNTFAIHVTDVDMDGKLEIGSVSAGQNASVTEESGHYTVSVVFNNSFVPAFPDPADIEVEIAVSKTVNNMGTAIMGREGFEFVLSNTADPDDKLKVESDEDGEAVFALTFTKDDIGQRYDYTLSETNEGVEGMDYDESEYHVSIAITRDEGTNTLVPAVTMTLEGQVVVDGIAAFTNTYDAELPPAEKAEVLVTIDKTVTSIGASSIGPEGFEFVLEDVVSHNKLVTESDNEGNAAFTLTFTEADDGLTYTYALYERDTGIEGVTYSEACYEIVVVVTKDAANNKMVAAVTMDGATVDAVEVDFENKYFMPSAPADITVPITVNKTVKSIGAGKISRADFEFVLENTDSGSKLTMKTDTNGKAVFELPFTASDIGKVFTYELSEVKGNMAGMSYDKDVYAITVAITEDTVNNALLAALTVNGKTVDEVKAAFENTYYAGSSDGGDTPESDSQKPDSQKPESGDTGDDSKVNSWFMMMILSGMASVALLILERSYAKKKD